MIRTASPLTAELAGRLRISVARLARLLRQQDQSGFGPTRGGRAGHRREARTDHARRPRRHASRSPRRRSPRWSRSSRPAGWSTRAGDPHDRRVTRVAVTAKGAKQLQTYRSRRTEWLAGRLDDLDAEDLALVEAALPVLERIIEAPERVLVKADVAAPERSATHARTFQLVEVPQLPAVLRAAR